MATFDLIAEPWIPVATLRGAEEVGLGTLFRRAHEFSSLAIADPLQWVALMRQVLLPILIDATGVPRDATEWERRHGMGRLDSDLIDDYLQGHRDRFDLFHPVAPFGQVVDLQACSGELRPSSLLLLNVATGNNVPLFGVDTEGDPPALTPGHATLAMLTIQCWDTAGLKTGAVGDPRAGNGKTTGNPTGPVGRFGSVLPVGMSLFETLLLNLPIGLGRHPANDLPPWRRPALGPSWEERAPTGVVDVLTWQARRVRLMPDQDGMVRRAVVTAGDRLVETPRDSEIHTMWRTVDKPRPGQSPIRPVRHESGRALWQGLPGMLALRAARVDQGSISTSILIEQLATLAVEVLPFDYRVRVKAVGIEYGNQNAIIENVIDDEMPLPMVALATDPVARLELTGVAAMAEGLRRAIDMLAKDLRRAAGGDDGDRGPGEQLLARLDLPTRRLLAGLQAHPHQVAAGIAAWRESAETIARDLAEGMLNDSAPSAFLGRQDARSRTWHRASTAASGYFGRLKAILGVVPPGTPQTGEVIP